MNRRHSILFLLGISIGILFAAPPEATENKILSIPAVRSSLKITVDGRISEEEWSGVPMVNDFRQVMPDEGKPASFDTDVRIQFTDEVVYIAAWCRDTVGWSGVRVPDLRRDFDFFSNDLFGVCFDPYGDARLSIAFQTNPYGAQRDLQVLDGVEYDRHWDAKWEVQASMSDSGWSVEMGIPWSTLRYPLSQSTWRINFVRTIRRLNETSAWSPWPREFDPYAMTYAGSVTGLVPPDPSLNARIMPSMVGRSSSIASGPFLTTMTGAMDAKWAVTPTTVLDLTLNTDFAETDVDDQVISLSRFSVFFPEKRQFFLENKNLFSVGMEGIVQPFFSRSIGLDASGSPVPITAGIRITSRTNEESFGGLFVRQSGGKPGSVGVVRYTAHVGETGRIGILTAVREDEAMGVSPVSTNFVAAVDGFSRPIQSVTVSGMLSVSRTNGLPGNGMAASAQVTFRPSWIYAFWQQAVISKDFLPASGFVAAQDLVQTSPGLYLDWRPEWKPSFIRSFEPGTFFNLYQRQSDLSFQQGSVNIFPLWVGFDDGSNASIEIEPTWHNFREVYAPLGAPLALGDAFYTRWRVIFNGDPSKAVSMKLRAATGRYFNGRLHAVTVGCTVAPDPHITADLQYTVNDAAGLGVDKKDITTHLLTPRVRFALNPKLQMMSQVQYNSFARTVRWNIRLSYEFNALSYFHVVINELQQEGEGAFVVREQYAIAKISYLYQL
jgi:hypothetical protein